MQYLCLWLCFFSSSNSLHEKKGIVIQKNKIIISSTMAKAMLGFIFKPSNYFIGSISAYLENTEVCDQYNAINESANQVESERLQENSKS